MSDLKLFIYGTLAAFCFYSIIFFLMALPDVGFWIDALL